MDQSALSRETIDIRTPEGVADAYLVRPAEGTARGAVLLLIDAFGLRPQIEGMADRIAADGYAVLAPNLFYRAGRAPVLPTEGLSDPEQRPVLLAQIGPLMAELTNERVIADGAAYLDTLARFADGPVAITGYCMGGRLGWTIATVYPDRVAALGAFHTGRLVTDDADSPHLAAGRLDAEVYLGHADNDASMDAGHIRALETALADAEVRFTSELYTGAAHGYTMADTAAYSEEAAARHYEALFALLNRTIGAA